MFQTKYLWGSLILVLIVLSLLSPLPAKAETPDQHDVEAMRYSTTLRWRAKTHSFNEVWNLILKHQRAHASHFSPELVACLMWEESGYRLVENNQSHALGFGQIMPSTLGEINKRYKTAFTRADMLTSPDKSVQATVLALELMYSWKKTKVAALVAYAGGFQNYRTIAKWITAEPKMIEARTPAPSGTYLVTSHSEPKMMDALHLCSQPGFHPKMIFD